MELTQLYNRDTLVAASGFVDANAAALPGVAQSGAKRQLDLLVADLVSHRSEQVERSRQVRAATQVHYANRRSLLGKHMAAIVAVAKAETGEYPDLKVVRMPSGNCNIGTLLEAATTVRNGAALHAAVFIAAGLPADFLAELDAAIAGMVQALDERKNASGVKAGATKGIRSTITAARKQLRILDKLVRNAAAGNDALLRNWEQVKRVPKPTSGGKATSAVSGSVAPAPAPAPVVQPAAQTAA